MAGQRDEPTSKHIKGASRNTHKKNTTRKFYGKAKERGFFKEKMVNIVECY